MAASKIKNFSELPVILKAQDVADVMGISVANAYLLFKQPGFPSIRVGEKRVICPRDKFLTWLDRQSDRQII